MTTISSNDLRSRTGDIRRAVNRGEQVQVTYHNLPLVTCVATDLWNRMVELAGDAGRKLLDDALEKGATAA